ncbi:DUF2235 domain-containing protein [Mycolicibacterium sp. GF69]|uniref:phospholipase effector Tle1 domain-containing protein n=1 Tax=Mycolicibacterium sp. GF69 TaxID=2267251 RepID=UPI000DCE7228|nr:DUF2235 domain-containing protein [Mycolicibacterium sp. GF69]RAV17036.1 DUF2235 domain-containing protein [Mycolicibacterium sp. GF69]
MKKLVLCFDQSRRYPMPETTTNAHRLFHLLDDRADQITWYHPGVGQDRATVLRRRKTVAGDARCAIAEAYRFLIERWEPGDPIFLFGVGRGGYCAQTLTRLLSTVGVLPELMDFVLGAYALPRTGRTGQDWVRVTQVAARLEQQREIPVPVRFLGLWDAVGVPGFTRRSMPVPMPNVELGRHAVAIDGRPGERLVAPASDHIEEVWFRGAHCDVAGGPGACEPLTEICFDWMLDGAIGAGLAVPAERMHTVPGPGQFDALAETPHTISIRRLPEDADIHCSVELYLREHPQYWKRLPGRVTWSDPDWAARGERLVRVDGASADRVLVGLTTSGACEETDSNKAGLSTANRG